MPSGNRIIGIGSANGDDRAGWRCIDLLRERFSRDDSEAIAIGEVTSILHHVEGCQRMAIVDACCSGAPAGTVTRCTWPDPRIHGQHRHSTHGLGIAETLKLAEQLGRLPAEVTLFGVEVSACQPGSEISQPVAAGLEALVAELALGW